MKTINLGMLLFLGMLLTVSYSFGQDQATVSSKMNKDLITKKGPMKTYLIEREIPDAGKLTKEQLQGIAQKSNEVLAQMGSSIQWVQSYVTDNKVYCVYKAENEKLLREHAEKGGFPANKISELSTIIDPETAKN